MKELRCVDLSYRPLNAKDSLILDDLNVSFKSNQLSLITGKIGSGKTTLLHLLSGLLRPSQGEIYFGDACISRYVGQHRDLYRRNVGLVFQSEHFIEQLNVIENIMLAIIPICSSLKDAQKRAEKELVRWQIEELSTKDISTLSGGEAQRVALARACVKDPPLLFADEPSAHQDAAGATYIQEELAKYAHEDKIVIVVSHESSWFEFDAVDHRYRLDGGKLIQAS